MLKKKNSGDLDVMNVTVCTMNIRCVEGENGSLVFPVCFFFVFFRGTMIVTKEYIHLVAMQAAVAHKKMHPAAVQIQARSHLMRCVAFIVSYSLQFGLYRLVRLLPM